MSKIAPCLGANARAMTLAEAGPRPPAPLGAAHCEACRPALLNLQISNFSLLQCGRL